MPMNGLSNVLEAMLGAVIASESLNTWSVHIERNCGVTFKLRFGGHNGESYKNTNDVKQQAFKRKSDSQINRDKLRAEKWRSNKSQMVTRSKVQHDDPEVPRKDLDCEDLGCILSPDTVCCDSDSFSLSPVLEQETRNKQLPDYLGDCATKNLVLCAPEAVANKNSTHCVNSNEQCDTESFRTTAFAAEGTFVNTPESTVESPCLLIVILAEI